MVKIKGFIMKKVTGIILSILMLITLISVPHSETSAASAVSIAYRTHVQRDGWQSWVSNGAMSGTSGESKRLEGIEIQVSGNSNLGIQYTTHVQTYGWQGWSCDGEMSGTEGESKRLEAIKIQLTGSDKDKYDVYYRVHAQTYGWLGWAKNGEPAGTSGYSKRLEGIQIVIVAKGASAPQTTYNGITSVTTSAYVTTGSSTVNVANSDTLNVSYRTQVQTYGWQNWTTNGGISGTSGQSKRLETIQIKASNKKYSGGIQYRTHVQTYGWQGWVSDGAMSGTVGQSKRLEAIEIKLTGELAEKYDIYYRVHAQTYGWLGWAKNGETAGTSGLSKRLETIQIVIVDKGTSAPQTTYGGITSVTASAYVTNTGSGTTQPTTPSHTHTWVVVTEEITVKDTHEEDRLIIDGVEQPLDYNASYIYTGGVLSYKAMINRVKAGMTEYDEPNYVSGYECPKCGYQTTTNDILDHIRDVCHCANWISGVTMLNPDNPYTHHTASVKTVTVVDGTYTEEVVTGYKCSGCRATK